MVQLQLDLRPATDRSKDAAWTIYGTGKFQIQYPVTGVVGEVRPDLPGMKLTTGKLELEVKEPFTAWGKEVGGLQAGLGFEYGNRRTYGHGQGITLVVRLRNVGKEAVKFEYLRQFLDENPPTVTNADDKTIPQSKTEVMGQHVPVSVTLEPGKEMILETRLHGSRGVPYVLIPPNSKEKRDDKVTPLVVATGKVQLQIEKVFGNSSSGFLKVDSALEKLSTGKLELEVTNEAVKSTTGSAETKTVVTPSDEKPVAKPPGANIVKVPDELYVNSGLPLDELAGEGVKWNDVQNGLSLGYRITGDEWGILSKGAKVELWVRNPGDKDVRFQCLSRPDIGLLTKMKDTKGKEHESNIARSTSLALSDHRLLPPGHAFKVKEFTVSLLRPENDASGVDGHYFGIAPGAYKFHCELELPGFSAMGEGGKQLTPAAGEWTGKLTTREMDVMVVAPDAPAATEK